MIKGISFTYMIYMANETFPCHSRSRLGNSAHVFTSAFMVFVLLFSPAAIQELASICPMHAGCPPWLWEIW